MISRFPELATLFESKKLSTLQSTVLGWLVSPWFFGLSAFVGAGLAFAGLSGTCAMARILALLPYNRQTPRRRRLTPCRGKFQSLAA